MKNELVYNAIQTPDGKVLESNSVHDYKFYEDKNTKRYMIDGGLEYCRRSAHGDEIDLCVYSDEPHEKVRQFAFRTGYGKAGNKDYGTFRITRIKDMSDEHLLNSLDYIERNVDFFEDKLKGNSHYQILLNEQKYRLENNIKVEESE